MAAPPNPNPPIGLDAALTAALAPLQAQLNAAQAQMANMQAQMAVLQATFGNMQAQIALINPAAIVAAAAQSLHAMEAARRSNYHDRRGVLYAPVPRSDGTLPPSWPAAGFDRAALVEGHIAVVDALLGDYGLPAGAGNGTVVARRVALAQALGTHLV